jgi:hypothetical protein
MCILVKGQISCSICNTIIVTKGAAPVRCRARGWWYLNAYPTQNGTTVGSGLREVACDLEYVRLWIQVPVSGKESWGYVDVSEMNYTAE